MAVINRMKIVRPDADEPPQKASNIRDPAVCCLCYHEHMFSCTCDLQYGNGLLLETEINKENGLM